MSINVAIFSGNDVQGSKNRLLFIPGGVERKANNPMCQSHRSMDMYHNWFHHGFSIFRHPGNLVVPDVQHSIVKDVSWIGPAPEMVTSKLLPMACHILSLTASE